MSKYQTPYRYDFVGSFLRPQEVKQAKADYSEGKITKEECDAIVDKAVTEELTGIWTLCGDSKALVMSRQEPAYSSMQRWQQ